MTIWVNAAGLRVPGATNLEELWDRLCRGPTAVSIETLDGLPFRDRVAVCRAGEGLGLRGVDRSIDLGLAATADALSTDAGFAAVEAPRRGVVVGTAFGTLPSVVEVAQALARDGARAVGPRTVPSLMNNALAAAIALHHGCRGPTYTVTTACASGTDAVSVGCQWLAADTVDQVVVCGADAPVVASVLTGFQRLGALSSEITDPDRACRPFDRDRTGFVMGEGASCMVLERERRASTLGSVEGWAATDDAYHVVAPDPAGGGARRSMELALRSAGLAPDSIGHVNAHGTATTLNDLAEAAAVSDLLGGSTPVTSSKGMFGHLMGAAGTTEAIATLLALRHGSVPPTFGYDMPDPTMAPIAVVRHRPLPSDGRYAISNSFAFGGHNANVGPGRGHAVLMSRRFTATAPAHTSAAVTAARISRRAGLTPSLTGCWPIAQYHGDQRRAARQRVGQREHEADDVAHHRDEHGDADGPSPRTAEPARRERDRRVERGQQRAGEDGEEHTADPNAVEREDANGHCRRHSDHRGHRGQRRHERRPPAQPHGRAAHRQCVKQLEAPGVLVAGRDRGYAGDGHAGEQQREHQCEDLAVEVPGGQRDVLRAERLEHRAHVLHRLEGLGALQRRPERGVEDDERHDADPPPRRRPAQRVHAPLDELDRSGTHARRS